MTKKEKIFIIPNTNLPEGLDMAKKEEAKPEQKQESEVQKQNAQKSEPEKKQLAEPKLARFTAKSATI